jgi:glyoxylase-like metal-dependent hydrolase (beta-lactamase superfamily II)
VSTVSGAIHHLNCATMCPRGGRLLGGEGGPLATHTVACHCLLIESADGLVLVDTGFGLGDIRNPRQLGRPLTALLRPRLDPDEAAISQLRGLGFEPGDVRHIVITHLDLDHAGGLPDFPEAEVHVRSRELAAAMNPSWRERPRYIQEQWGHGPRWVEHGDGGDEWFGFEGLRILPGSNPEILLIPLPGHTVGHTGVAIRRGDRWLLHCGDAYFHRGEVETPAHCPPGLAVFQMFNQIDGAARRRNRERLGELAKRHGGEVELICSHDASYLERESMGGDVPQASHSA